MSVFTQFELAVNCRAPLSAINNKNNNDDDNNNNDDDNNNDADNINDDDNNDDNDNNDSDNNDDDSHCPGLIQLSETYVNETMSH